jgi:hypothetical protein
MTGNGFVLTQHYREEAASREITIKREKLIQ